jgi:acetoin utilization deacetylase AcuC-like enzyme
VAFEIPVFYTPKQVVVDNKSLSPSAKKPIDVLASWQVAGFPLIAMEPLPVMMADFYRAHDPEHVRDVLMCVKANGFSNTLPSVAMSLPWTNGSFLSAARYVLNSGGVAVSPTSGFHHAGYMSCEGFCTFNGLMVTVMALRADGFKGTIGILDLDEHYGNGTDNILSTTDVEGVNHYSYGAQDLNRGDGDKWLIELQKVADNMATECQLVLYQAGADPHTDDPYGRGVLNDAQLYERDRIVFKAMSEKNTPIVWNLAGGYQQPLRKVLNIHDNTMRACVEFYGNKE